jgi:hypothetical protein
MHVLEFGGEAVFKNRRRFQRRLRGGGEIRVDGNEGGTTKPTVDRHGRRRLVTYIKLRTQAQVDRANEINAALYGPKEERKPIGKRPFMGPALSKEIQAGTIPRMWLNSVRVTG